MVMMIVIITVQNGDMSAIWYCNYGMANVNVVEKPQKALMFIMYMDLTIKSMKYYVLTAMLSIMEMMKSLITDHMIRIAKFVVKLVHGRRMKIDGNLLIQMERFMFASI